MMRVYYLQRLLRISLYLSYFEEIMMFHYLCFKAHVVQSEEIPLNILVHKC